MGNLPALYTVFQEVAKSQTMEPLSNIPDCQKQGLVGTRMSSYLVDKPSEIVDVGDKVWMKLTGRETKNDRIKLFFSMKGYELRDWEGP